MWEKRITGSVEGRDLGHGERRERAGHRALHKKNTFPKPFM